MRKRRAFSLGLGLAALSSAAAWKAYGPAGRSQAARNQPAHSHDSGSASASLVGSAIDPERDANLGSPLGTMGASGEGQGHIHDNPAETGKADPTLFGETARLHERPAPDLDKRS